MQTTFFTFSGRIFNAAKISNITFLKSGEVRFYLDVPNIPIDIKATWEEFVELCNKLADTHIPNQ